MQPNIDATNQSVKSAPQPLSAKSMLLNTDSVWQESIVCRSLLNPRGLAFTQQGDLLLVEAGGAEPAPPFSGRVTLRDRHTGEVKQTLLDGYRALNMQARMHRDEIMGLADLAITSEDDSWLVAFTDYIDGSKVLELQTSQTASTANDNSVTTLFETQGNINSLCYHPERQAWYGVKPDTNEVMEFVRGKAERVVCVLPDLALEQEAVPVNIVYQASTGYLLISLFSGELGQGDEFKGIDFTPHQGEIVVLDPENGELFQLVTGLTLPTGLCLTDDDKILVTELCDEFLQALPPDHIPEKAMHGGFKRFSGRLLRIDPQNNRVEQLITGLDTPSNLAVYDGAIYISEGMGLPDRPIPNPNGIQPLEGFVRKVVEEK